jgi:hypothetical protein
MPTREEIQDERRRERHVRLIADFTCTVIMQTRMARTDAEGLVQAARSRILELFPGREETYELLYAPRFRRILDEFAGPNAEDPRGRVITFPGRPRT